VVAGGPCEIIHLTYKAGSDTQHADFELHLSGTADQLRRAEGKLARVIGVIDIVAM
jgi:hypothetical protein